VIPFSYTQLPSFDVPGNPARDRREDSGPGTTAGHLAVAAVQREAPRLPPNPVLRRGAPYRVRAAREVGVCARRPACQCGLQRFKLTPDTQRMQGLGTVQRRGREPLSAGFTGHRVHGRKGDPCFRGFTSVFGVPGSDGTLGVMVGQVEVAQR